MRRRKRIPAKHVAVIALLVPAGAGLLLAARHLNVAPVMLAALAWIAGLGPVGPLLLVLLYVAACLLALPGSILTLGAGALFGLVQGGISVFSGALLGATCAFLVGRHLARDQVARRIARHPKFQKIDEAVAKEGWKIVLLTRLSPAFPFNLLNYAFGLSKVSLKDYFWASALGMIPGTLMYVYIGSLAGSLAAVGTAGRARTAEEWALLIIGLAATVAVTLLLTRLARRALSARIDPRPQQGQSS